VTAAPQLSIVIPAYNEARRIGQTLAELQAALPSLGIDWEIRVVDDGSTDETGALVERVSRADARVVLQREPHRGKGGTVRAGLLGARGDLRFMCDADLSMPVNELPRFLDAVPARADVAIGSREGVGARRVGEPVHRHWMGRIFNTLVRAGTVMGISDTQCGFKLFSARAVETIFPHVTIEGWAFDIEVLTIARRRGLRIMELPIEWHYREHSRVSLARDSFRMARDVFRVRMNLLRGRYDP
jgi:glycosyltransferase involved in cell wall biosynthesis